MSVCAAGTAGLDNKACPYPMCRIRALRYFFDFIPLFIRNYGKMQRNRMSNIMVNTQTKVSLGALCDKELKLDWIFECVLNFERAFCWKLISCENRLMKGCFNAGGNISMSSNRIHGSPRVSNKANRLLLTMCGRTYSSNLEQY